MKDSEFSEDNPSLDRELDREIDQFCQGVKDVLTKIYDRIDKVQSKKQKKKKKPATFVEPEEFTYHDIDPSETLDV
jgi:hypothetical protein